MPPRQFLRASVPLAAFLLQLFLLAPLCSAQESTVRPEALRIGGYVSAQWLGYSVDVKGLPGIPSCCPEYTGGHGDGLAIGLGVEPRMSPQFSLGGRLLLVMYNSTLSAEEYELVTAERDTVTAVFGHTIETIQPSLAADLFATYEVIPRLSLMGGARVDVMLGGSYHQKEEILSPSTIRFENDRRTRLVRDGSIPDENTLHLAATAGVRYDIPMNAEQTLFLTPELQVWQGFNDIVSNTSWTMRGVRLGISCSFIRREGPGPTTPLNPNR